MASAEEKFLKCFSAFRHIASERELKDLYNSGTKVFSIRRSKNTAVPTPKLSIRQMSPLSNIPAAPIFAWSRHSQHISNCMRHGRVYTRH
jgi:hypothetical protein